MSNKRQAYKIEWQYYWAGEQLNGNETIGLLYNNLKVDIKAKETIYPGEKDSITITTTDFHNKPIANVNLAAVSYNSKFGNDIKMPKMPFIATYKLKKNLQYNTYDLDENTISKKYSIAKNIKWLELLKADTSLFYSCGYSPKISVTDIAIPITNTLPQVAVNIVENGIQKKIYILYINRKPVYYSNATNNKPFSFETDLGYTQFGIRIQDKYIEN